MNICLGYIVLILNKLGKYLNMSYRYPMAFRGSRSVIMKFKGESLSLFIYRVTDRGKSGFEAALRHLHINIFQLLMSISQGKVKKIKKLDYVLQCFINYLYLDSVDSFGYSSINQPQNALFVERVSVHGEKNRA